MKALVVVDYQVDFVDGALGFPGAEKLEQIILDKIADCRSSGGQVIFTLDTHGEDYLSTAEGRKLPVPHCMELCGLVTDICVISNAVIAKAALPESRVAVDHSACSCADPEAHERALAVMRGVQIDVI